MLLARFFLLTLLASLVSGQYAIQTVAGSNWDGDGGSAISALLIQPEGVVVDPRGNLYVADANDHRVRKVAPDGTIQTVAGTGVPGFSGDGGPGTSAQLNRPYGIALDKPGNLYIADLGNARVRVLSLDGTISTFAGGGAISPIGVLSLPATSASLNSPRNVAVGTGGLVFVSDFGGQQVYAVQNRTLTVVAGSGASGYSGDGGPASEAQLNYPAGLAADASGNLFIADSSNNSVRQVSSGVIQTIASVPSPVGLALDRFGILYVAGANYLGSPALGSVLADTASDLFIDSGGDLFYSLAREVQEMTYGGVLNTVAGNGAGLAYGDGLAATSARLNLPAQAVADSAGNIYIADTSNNEIREVTTDGNIATIAGKGDIALSSPSSLAVDSSGNLYIADTGSGRVIGRSPSGNYTTVLTNLKNPSAVAVDAAGNVYAADRDNGRIVSVNPSGVISIAASVAGPTALAVDSVGNLYVGDSSQNALLEITPGGSPAILWHGNEAPGGIAVDSNGNVFFSQTSANQIFEISPSGAFAAIAGTGIPGFSGDDGLALSAQLMSPTGLAIDGSGSILFADAANNRIRKLSLTVVEPPPVETLPPVVVLNAASSLPGPIAAGEIVSIYGKGFDPKTAQVRFSQTPAHVFFAGPTQINALAPAGLVPGASVDVTVSSGGVPVGSLTVAITAAAPGIFEGSPGHAVATNQDSGLNGAGNPARAGSILVLWATGQGERSSVATLAIGGKSAELIYAANAPGFPGLMQVNARVPSGLAPGSQPVILTIGGVSSQPGVSVAVE